MVVYTLHKTNCAVIYADSDGTQKAYTAAVGQAKKLIQGSRQELQSAEEAELELLCIAIDDDSFVTAMADCVLIPESPWEAHGICNLVACCTSDRNTLFGLVW